MRGISDTQIMGNLSMKPIITYTKTGRKKAFVTVAVERNWRDATTGEIQSRVCFVPIVAWESKATLLEQYCEKGSRVYIKGRLDIQVKKTEDSVTSRMFIVMQEIIFISAATPPAGKGITPTAEIEPDDTQPVTDEDIYDENSLTEAEIKYFNLMGSGEIAPE